MPLIRISGRILYFAHVPKCAGTALELFLESHIGPLAFRNSAFNRIPPEDRWTRSSPQHVDAASLALLFPPNFIDESFAVVRHPVDRIVSVFRFQRDIEGRIETDMPFGNWLDSVAKEDVQGQWALDNHTRTMDAIVPEKARIFRLENGLEPVVAWLQGILGPDTQLPRTVPPRNVLSDRLAHEGRPDIPVRITPDIIDKIAAVYRADFDRFGYEPGQRLKEEPRA
ncbi:sulfotransferase family 2 domain-containing protein [Roseovarius sp. S4756]|uniref:sulfotransferase family 2 domain-containing protein n=1 Tax=Roseovarius maritimus TaxID=3342637 RepID=UPI003727038E